MPELLKERYFKNRFIEQLASRIHDIYPVFDESKFKTLVFDPAWREKEEVEQSVQARMDAPAVKKTDALDSNQTSK